MTETQTSRRNNEHHPLDGGRPLGAGRTRGRLHQDLHSQGKLEHHDGAAWTRGVNPAFVKALGVLELLAAIGLILPAVVDVAPVMVPVTALCWVALMIGAMITHARLGQFKLVMVNSVYLALAVLIAVGRFGPESFTA